MVRTMMTVINHFRSLTEHVNRSPRRRLEKQTTHGCGFYVRKNSAPPW